MYENEVPSLRMREVSQTAFYALQIVDFQFQYSAFDIECMTQMALLKKYMGNF
jgi:hypothetical protein